VRPYIHVYMQGGMKLFGSMLHTEQSSIQSDKYQVSHRYSYFSWWWAHSRPKHVEKRIKHTKKNCAPSWLYLQDYAWMSMHKDDMPKFSQKEYSANSFELFAVTEYGYWFIKPNP
jgi:hypothetical protein